MKLQYLGTGAAEGIPALFCTCDICKNAWQKGGKEIRTRSQAIVDDRLLIDFPPDAYMHMLQNKRPYSEIEHLLVTHSHHDHYFPKDLAMRVAWFSHGMTVPMHVYGNDKVGAMFEKECGGKEKYLVFHEVQPFETYEIAGYSVTPLLANHDKSERCYIYLISSGGKTLLYGNDTGYFLEETWQYLTGSNVKLSLISLDCTSMSVPDGNYHMGLSDCIKVKERILSQNLADENAVFYVHHFSHNGVWTHEQIEQKASESGFLVSYDGCAEIF